PEDTVRDVERRIKQLLETRVGVASDRLAYVGPETPLLEQGLALDSVEAFELACGLEEEFRFEFGADEFSAATFRTIGTLTSVITAKLGDQAARSAAHTS